MNVDELKAENERLKKDLDLAANIAKTFIEKNSDLEKELEATHDRYVVKIEQLQQDCYSLQRKLSCSSENEASLSAEVDLLRGQLTRTQETCSRLELSTKKLEQALAEQDETLHQKATDEMERIRSRVTDLEEQLCKCHQLNQQLLSLDNTSLQSNDESHNMTLVAREQELQLLLDRAQGDADSLRATGNELQNRLKEAEDRLRETLDLLTVERGARKKRECEAADLQAQLDNIHFEQVDMKRRGNSLFSEVEDRRLKQKQELLKMQTRFQAVHEEKTFLRDELRRTRNQMALLLATGERQADARHIRHLQDSLAIARADIAKLTNALSCQESLTALVGGQVPLAGLLQMERKRVMTLEKERAALFAARVEQSLREDQLLKEAHQAALKAEAMEAKLLRLQLSKDECTGIGNEKTVHENIGMVEEEPPVLREMTTVQPTHGDMKLTTEADSQLKLEGTADKHKDEKCQPRVTFQDYLPGKENDADTAIVPKTKKSKRRGTIVVAQNQMDLSSAKVVSPPECNQQ